MGEGGRAEEEGERGSQGRGTEATSEDMKSWGGGGTYMGGLLHGGAATWGGSYFLDISRHR